MKKHTKIDIDATAAKWAATQAKKIKDDIAKIDAMLAKMAGQQ